MPPGGKATATSAPLPRPRRHRDHGRRRTDQASRPRHPPAPLPPPGRSPSTDRRRRSSPAETSPRTTCGTEAASPEAGIKAKLQSDLQVSGILSTPALLAGRHRYSMVSRPAEYVPRSRRRRWSAQVRVVGLAFLRTARASAGHCELMPQTSCPSPAGSPTDTDSIDQPLPLPDDVSECCGVQFGAAICGHPCRMHV